MSVAAFIATLLTLVMLPLDNSRPVLVHITTSDAIDLARKIARDEGYDVTKTNIYSFDLLITPEGKPFLRATQVLVST